jgi:hypothetical protein
MFNASEAAEVPARQARPKAEFAPRGGHGGGRFRAVATCVSTPDRAAAAGTYSEGS